MPTITYVKPSKNDVLGDRWAGQVRRLYDQALAKLGIEPIGPGMGAVWNLFQWQYCQLADMPSRVVASPQAMAMCGWKITDEMLATVERLLEAQSEILNAEG